MANGQGRGRWRPPFHGFGAGADPALIRPPQAARGGPVTSVAAADDARPAKVGGTPAKRATPLPALRA